MSAVDIKQLDTFKAATLFAQAEGIIPAPESSHAIAAAIHEAEQAKIEGKPRTILFNLSGHGLIDMAAYDQPNRPFPLFVYESLNLKYVLWENFFVISTRDNHVLDI